jgi:hypothetical protein
MATQEEERHSIDRYRLHFRWLAWVILSLLVITSACQAGKDDPLQPGEAAPGFTLESARGGKVRLQDAFGQTILLAFLDTQAEAGETADPSRSQVVTLKSMQEQYGPDGLSVLIVDASRLRTSRDPGGTDLLNYTYDWQLETIPVLADPGGKITSQYGVTSLPTTFLVGADGTILQRWDGLASASQLAFAVQAALGIPIF